MLLSLGEWDYLAQVVELSEAVERLEKGNQSLKSLNEMDVNYIYIGSKGDFSGPGLIEKQLRKADEVNLAYQNNGVAILRINAEQN